MTRVQEILRMPIGVFLMALLVGIPHVPVRPLELPEDFAQEGDAVQAAIQENARFQERHQPPNLSENRVAYWNMETGRWEVVRAGGQVRIPTDLGYLTYPATAGSAYRVETVTALRPIVEEPEYTAPNPLENAIGLPGYKEPQDPSPIESWIVFLSSWASLTVHIFTWNDYWQPYHTVSAALVAGVFPYAAWRGRSKERTEERNAIILLEANNRRQQQAFGAYSTALARVRDENQQNRDFNRNAAIAVHDLTSNTVVLVWYGDPRIETP
jgi:hypothetical protein